MKHVDTVLHALAPGHFVSGETLAAEMGISRAAVWKQLRKLQTAGVPIDAVRGRGYRIAGGNPLLTHEAVMSALSLPARTHLRSLDVRWTLGSTNAELLAREYDDLPAACLAEMQTEGRGRQGRHWTSPFGAGVWLSLAWPFGQLPTGFSALGLVAGIAVVGALGSLGVHGVGLKWPNDLMVDDRKLGGLLVETRGEAAGRMRAVIGIGINWRMPYAGFTDAFALPWTDLARVLDEPPPRTTVAAQAINHLCLALDQFEREGFGAFLARWQALDVLAGHPVRVRTGAREIDGVARGIDDEGALIVDAHGHVERCTAGEVSVRRV